ncbi:hypothetical protein BYT27DRAFT_6458575 [Phlegmacium glaucopus]|nr:hypothetical protein BYT27DRAFT_6458575 [Phlegmacium glaucopus]
MATPLGHPFSSALSGSHHEFLGRNVVRSRIDGRCTTLFQQLLMICGTFFCIAFFFPIPSRLLKSFFSALPSQHNFFSLFHFSS